MAWATLPPELPCGCPGDHPLSGTSLGTMVECQSPPPPLAHASTRLGGQGDLRGHWVPATPWTGQEAHRLCHLTSPCLQLGATGRGRAGPGLCTRPPCPLPTRLPQWGLGLPPPVLAPCPGCLCPLSHPCLSFPSSKPLLVLTRGQPCWQGPRLDTHLALVGACPLLPSSSPLRPLPSPASPATLEPWPLTRPSRLKTARASGPLRPRSGQVCVAFLSGSAPAPEPAQLRLGLRVEKVPLPNIGSPVPALLARAHSSLRLLPRCWTGQLGRLGVQEEEPGQPHSPSQRARPGRS